MSAGSHSHSATSTVTSHQSLATSHQPPATSPSRVFHSSGHHRQAARESSLFARVRLPLAPWVGGVWGETTDRICVGGFSSHVPLFSSRLVSSFSQLHLPPPPPPQPPLSSPSTSSLWDIATSSHRVSLPLLSPLLLPSPLSLFSPLLLPPLLFLLPPPHRSHHVRRISSSHCPRPQAERRPSLRVEASNHTAATLQRRATDRARSA